MVWSYHPNAHETRPVIAMDGRVIFFLPFFGGIHKKMQAIILPFGITISLILGCLFIKDFVILVQCVSVGIGIKILQEIKGTNERVNGLYMDPGI